MLYTSCHYDLHHHCVTVIIKTFTYLCVCPGPPRCFTQFKDLPPMANLNVWADQLAKQELHQLATLPSYPTPTDTIMGEVWAASITGTKIASDHKVPTLDSLGMQTGLPILGAQRATSPETLPLVTWNHLDTAICSYPSTFQMLLSKFASGHSAIGTTISNEKMGLCDLPSMPIAGWNYSAHPSLSILTTCIYASKTRKWTTSNNGWNNPTWPHLSNNVSSIHSDSIELTASPCTPTLSAYMLPETRTT